MLKKILKPWFIHNPLLITRALIYDIGMAPHGWTWVKTCFHQQIYCDTSKAIGRAIYKNGVYELATSELVWRLLKNTPEALFVDVGANIGYYSLLAHKRLGNNGRVMSFEPVPDIYEKLAMNIQGMNNIEAYQFAVSSSNGEATLSIPKGSESNDGISTLQDCTDALDSFTVQTISLDKFLDKKIHILKIDVEGHEYSALFGAKNLLASGRINNILFEGHDIEHSDVVSLLIGFGYKIFSIGWDMKMLVLKPLGEPNSCYVQDAPNYIATLNTDCLETAVVKTGWTILLGD
jgi:FkbM family methyltransferase